MVSKLAVSLVLASCGGGPGEGVSACRGPVDCPDEVPYCRADMRCWSTPDPGVDASMDAYVSSVTDAYVTPGTDAYVTPGTDAYVTPGVDAYVAPGIDAFVVPVDAFVAPGTDAFMADPDAYLLPSPDAYVPPATDASALPDTGGPCGGGPLLTFYRDADGDGHGGAAGGTAMRCAAGGGYVASNDDCDDGNAERFPGAAERCNNADDDCNGAVDGAPAASACSVPHATPACVSGVCSVATCSPGYEDCDGVPTNGCEADLMNSPSTCGACTTVCGVAAECASGFCDTTIAGLVGGPGWQLMCAIRSTGRLACWGDLGRPSLVYRPEEPSGLYAPLTNLTSVVGAHTFSPTFAIVHPDGTVGCFGTNSAGQFGNGAISSVGPVWGTYLVSDAVQAVAEEGHTCVRRRTGGVTCAGSNAAGELGDGTTTPHATPAAVVGLGDAVDLESAGTLVCAIRSSGQVVCWGTVGAWSSLTPTRTVPWWSSSVTDAVALELRGSGICLARAAGRVECTGGGRSTTGVVTIPGGVVDMVSASDATCALNSSGDVYCWSVFSNTNGVLGSGGLPGDVVNRISGLGIAVRIAGTGIGTMCALDTTGTVRCWGRGTLIADGRASEAPTVNPTPSMIVDLR